MQTHPAEQPPAARITDMSIDGVLDFWFVETPPSQWWTSDPAFDALLAQRFAAVHAAAAAGELYAWRAEPRGRLAEVIVLDQFSRNLHRGRASAFASDSMALALAQEAVAAGHDLALVAQERAFLYMPYMHSESLVVHREAERLFSALGLAASLDEERRHRSTLERFGRYPMRNAAFGRASTPEELAFLREPRAAAPYHRNAEEGSQA